MAKLISVGYRVTGDSRRRKVLLLSVLGFRLWEKITRFLTYVHIYNILGFIQLKSTLESELIPSIYVFKIRTFIIIVGILKT